MKQNNDKNTVSFVHDFLSGQEPNWYTKPDNKFYVDFIQYMESHEKLKTKVANWIDHYKFVCKSIEDIPVIPSSLITWNHNNYHDTTIYRLFEAGFKPFCGYIPARIKKTFFVESAETGKKVQFVYFGYVKKEDSVFTHTTEDSRELSKAYILRFKSYKKDGGHIINIKTE